MMMHRFLAATAVTALLAACGSGTDGSGSVGPGTQQVTVQVSGHGTIQLSTGQQCKDKCVVSVGKGARVSATASPDDGWTFSGWSGSCSGSTTCQFTVDRDVELDAAFALEPTGPNQHVLTAARNGSGTIRSSPAGIDCGSSCSAAFDDGTTVTLAATPDQGWRFDGWGSGCSGPGSCVVQIAADVTVWATFVKLPSPQHALSVALAGNGSGHVDSSPAGIDCGTTCSASFDEGASVTLSAQPADGSSFSGWSGACSGTGDCTVAMNADATVTATFVAGQPPPPAQVHLAASITGAGTVTGGGLNCGESSSTCDVIVAGGSQVTLTASAAGGARFFGWGGACSGTATTCQLTVQSDTKVTAEFQSEVMVLAPNDGTNGGPPDCVFCSRHLAINSTQLFWNRYQSEENRDGSSIWAIPKKGGTAVHVADRPATAMVADDAYLYWTDSRSLYSTPVGGGEVALLAWESAEDINQLALDETGALYYVTSRGLGNDGAVHRMQNRVDTVLASGQNAISIAVDATHVYYGDASGGIASLRRVPRNGGALESVYSCGDSCYVAAIRVDSANVYFRATTTGHVQALSKSDFSVRTLSGANSGGYQYPVGVDANASVVYWNWLGGAPYGIFRANADGTGFAAVDTSNDDSSWYGLRVDDSALYYFHAGAIIRRLK
jgi:hypothetical protein